MMATGARTSFYRMVAVFAASLVSAALVADLDHVRITLTPCRSYAKGVRVVG
jgi:hypothetical protein